jgi:hypothetical protein
VYNAQTGKLVNDDSLEIVETEEERTVRVLLSIANSVQHGIIMEADHPGRNIDSKLAILDMKVSMDNEKFAVYQHYEKPVSSKQVIHAQSALSPRCKLSVHVSEIVRRILNTSCRLDWDNTTSHFLTDYMVRMKEAGYNEKYRKMVLERAFKRYDNMVRDAEDGKKPLHRPKDWQKEERIREKRRKKHSWATRGGCIAPIIIPPTPNSELLSMLSQVAKEEALPGLRFKLVESGGKTIKRSIQKSNPTSNGMCQSGDCVVCRGGEGGGGCCRKSNVVYEYLVSYARMVNRQCILEKRPGMYIQGEGADQDLSEERNGVFYV